MRIEGGGGGSDPPPLLLYRTLAPSPLLSPVEASTVRSESTTSEATIVCCPFPWLLSAVWSVLSFTLSFCHLSFFVADTSGYASCVNLCFVFFTFPQQRSSRTQATFQLSRLSAEQLAALRETFALFDKDGDGTVPRGDLLGVEQPGVFRSKNPNCLSNKAPGFYNTGWTKITVNNIWL